jgi:hypothetical protein
MPAVGFETMIPVFERKAFNASHRAATMVLKLFLKINSIQTSRTFNIFKTLKTRYVVRKHFKNISEMKVAALHFGIWGKYFEFAKT